jgi:ATPase family associated with various cellular activities (AAA)
MSKSAFVRIKSGAYRTHDVSGQVFQLVEQFKNTAKGGYVTVKNGGKFPGFPEDIRVKVEGMTDYEFVGADEFDGAVMAVDADVQEAINDTKTDEERMSEIAERFEILHDMTKACVNGDIRAMIVSGPPGVGKSFGVEQEIEKVQMVQMLGSNRLRAEVVKGSASPIGLYQTLYKYSDPNCVVVFDDCDSILLDDVSLNLLKGALDSGKKRKISWLSESRVLKEEGIPDSFEFKGSVIFITNLKFDKMKSQKLKDHLDALQSRCHYLDLTLDTQRDKILRIKQIAKTGELFADLEIDDAGANDIIEFMDTNKNSLRELSLRMAIKVGQLYKSFPLRWKAMASTTCMKMS